MKKLNLLVLTLLFTTSFAYADVVSDLQTKKNNTQKAGISYTVVVPGDYDGAAVCQSQKPGSFLRL